MHRRLSTSRAVRFFVVSGGIIAAAATLLWCSADPGVGHPDAGETSDASDAASSCTPSRTTPQCTAGWCQIPAGCGFVGSPAEEWGHTPYGEDLTKVTLTHATWMMAMEITRAQVASLGFPIRLLFPATKGCTGSDCADASLDYYETLQLANALSRSNGLEECYTLTSCNVVEMNPGLPITVCDSATSSKPKLYECDGVRLATTVEWEYAVRAGTTTGMYGGEATTQLDVSCHPDPVADEIGWYCADQDGGHLLRGGLKKPNRWGLYDMAGNSLEWVNERYDPEWYHRMPPVDPWEVLGTSKDPPVLRGGGVTGPALNMRSASRLFGPSTSFAGFRLVRSITKDGDQPPTFPPAPLDAGAE